MLLDSHPSCNKAGTSRNREFFASLIPRRARFVVIGRSLARSARPLSFAPLLLSHPALCPLPSLVLGGAPSMQSRTSTGESASAAIDVDELPDLPLPPRALIL